MSGNPDCLQVVHRQSNLLPKAPRVSAKAGSFSTLESARHRLVVHQEADLTSMLKKRRAQDENSNAFSLSWRLFRTHHQA